MVLVVLLLLFFGVVIFPLLFKSEIAQKEDYLLSLPPEEALLIKVYNHREGIVMELGLEDYLMGVVAAEMPASFHLEALKAQAVAARTYTLRRFFRSADIKCAQHPEAHLCTDFAHCQAWIGEERALEKWGGETGEENWARIREAVNLTAGLVLKHEGKLIDAVYHSTCGGHTVPAAQVWSGSALYLVGGSCYYCRHSPWYKTKEVISYQAFQEIFSETGVLAVMTATGKPGIKILERFSDGRIEKVRVGETVFPSSQFRQKLGLPSTWFEYSLAGRNIYFYLRGHGHGVGLCQYGADGMAQEGRTFREILKHYYFEVEIESF